MHLAERDPGRERVEPEQAKRDRRVPGHAGGARAGVGGCEDADQHEPEHEHAEQDQRQPDAVLRDQPARDQGASLVEAAEDVVEPGLLDQHVAGPELGQRAEQVRRRPAVRIHRAARPGREELAPRQLGRRTVEQHRHLPRAVAAQLVDRAVADDPPGADDRRPVAERSTSGSTCDDRNVVRPASRRASSIATNPSWTSGSRPSVGSSSTASVGVVLERLHDRELLPHALRVAAHRPVEILAATAAAPRRARRGAPADAGRGH